MPKRKARASKKRKQSVRGKEQRIRDPIHDLVVFEQGSEIDQLIWRLINCREFQRLRRVKQLGFSEFVFPGATHTRLSHCIGVFHTARQVLEILLRLLGSRDERRVCVALCAALLHDLGHGPFSHVFENVAKDIGRKKRHESWTSEIILGDTEVNAVLRDHDSELPKEVSAIISAEDPVDIYSAIVSSQFDADRLDYLRRDRYMCGVSVGAFDFSWILKNLVVGKVYHTVDKDQGVGGKIDWLLLDPKAREAAEGYLLARYQLYSTIYYHKTTRSAEKLLSLFLKELRETAKHWRSNAWRFGQGNPVVSYLLNDNPTLETYLSLDDTLVWTLLSEASRSSEENLAQVAGRLMNRNLFKAFDLSRRAEASNSSAIDFVHELKEDAQSVGLEWGKTLFEDRPRQKGYDWYDWDTQSSLKKVLIRDKEHNGNEDIGSSPIVAALREKQFLRLYVPDNAAVERLEKRWKERGNA